MREPKVITLANLASSTEQEVFDHVVYRLYRQDWKQSVSDDGVTCRYRGAHGRACAAGHCMTDEEYNSERMEGTVWKMLWLDGVVPRMHGGLISALQRAHDESSKEYHMPNHLRTVAGQFGLSAELLDSLDGADADADEEEERRHEHV